MIVTNTIDDYSGIAIAFTAVWKFSRYCQVACRRPGLLTPCPVPKADPLKDPPIEEVRDVPKGHGATPYEAKEDFASKTLAKVEDKNPEHLWKT